MSRKILHKLQQITATTTTAANIAVRVYIIRHGETNWNKKGKIQGGGYDVPLNENGKAQAKMTAQALEGIKFDAVASSALLRAKETADIFHAHHADHGGKKPLRIVDTGFNEMRFGKFEGLSSVDTARDEKLKQHFLDEKRKVWEDSSYPFPPQDEGHAIHPDDDFYRLDCAGNGESTDIVEDRTMRALSETIQKVLKETNDPSTTKHVAIVSHGRTNKVLIGGMLGGGSTKARSIAQSNANISVLDHLGWGSDSHDTVNAKGGWITRIINSTEHIEEIKTVVGRP